MKRRAAVPRDKEEPHQHSYSVPGSSQSVPRRTEKVNVRVRRLSPARRSRKGGHRKSPGRVKKSSSKNSNRRSFHLSLLHAYRVLRVKRHGWRAATPLEPFSIRRWPAWRAIFPPCEAANEWAWFLPQTSFPGVVRFVTLGKIQPLAMMRLHFLLRASVLRQRGTCMCARL